MAKPSPGLRSSAPTSIIAAETRFKEQHPNGWITMLENCWTLALIKHGPGLLMSDGVEIPLEARDALLFPPMAEQKFPGGAANAAHEQYWVTFHLHPTHDTLIDWPEIPGCRVRRLHVESEDLWQEAINSFGQMRAILFKKSPPRRLEAAFVMLEMVLLWLDGANVRSVPGDDDLRVQQAILYLERHLQDPIRPVDVAKASNLSPDYCATLYKQITGMTPMRHLEMMRLERAKHRLTYPDDTLDAVADDCGFCNAYHFSNVFHRRTGLRPSVFRKQAWEEKRKQKTSP